ncbi:MAG: PEP-CTERM sorting domain-containing protein, partial [Verrucomicrobiaceae bacterium]|nr:PEP-CTERM sorting domain-containing protein [Verrucomicrobiaceae bacterium]
YGWIKYVGFAVAQVPLLGPNGEILGYTLGINSPGGFVDEWGYETTPNTPIFAGTPEPGRGVLMLVAGTVTLLRRRRVS